jgi:glycosyltransferase involved in cell wall biosynthesis
MRIAMIGQKGIPASYGGVERHVEELATRLAARGHAVRVYNRPHYGELQSGTYRGVQIVTLPSVATKHLDAISHTAACTTHAVATGAELIHFHAEGPSLWSWLPRILPREPAVVATIHGQDWLRPKWGKTASLALRMGEWMAMRVPHETIVVSASLTRALSEKHHQRAWFIPNGISIDPGDDTSILGELGIADGRYVLFASRLVPEKGAHYLIAAAQSAELAVPLVLAGDSSFSQDYVDDLKAKAAGAPILFPGYVYGARLAALFRHTALFVLPSDLEGLPIVLLEALAYGAPVLASDIPPNLEVLDDFGTTFRAGDVRDLRVQLERCLDHVQGRRQQAKACSDGILREYDWDAVTDQTEDVYGRALCDDGRATRRPPRR